MKTILQIPMDKDRELKGPMSKMVNGPKSKQTFRTLVLEPELVVKKEPFFCNWVFWYNFFLKTKINISGRKFLQTKT